MCVCVVRRNNFRCCIIFPFRKISTWLPLSTIARATTKTPQQQPNRKLKTHTIQMPPRFREPENAEPIFAVLCAYTFIHRQKRLASCTHTKLFGINSHSLSWSSAKPNKTKNFVSAYSIRGCSPGCVCVWLTRLPNHFNEEFSF